QPCLQTDLVVDSSLREHVRRSLAARTVHRSHQADRSRGLLSAGHVRFPRPSLGLHLVDDGVREPRNQPRTLIGLLDSRRPANGEDKRKGWGGKTPWVLTRRL